jgi:hypothetical protein
MMMRRVANRQLAHRVTALLDRRGGLTSLELAHGAYGRRANSRAVVSASEASALRRALARLRRLGVITDTGRRGRWKIYWRQVDADQMDALSLGPLDG